MTASLREGTYSPPKYQQRRLAEEAVVLLEDRLEHFIEWLRERGVVLWDFSGGELEGHEADGVALVDEYVNT